jgi:hypothetical protein
MYGMLLSSISDGGRKSALPSAEEKNILAL